MYYILGFEIAKNIGEAPNWILCTSLTAMYIVSNSCSVSVLIMPMSF